MTTDINMFEQASRRKIRFDYRGNISVEDLWDLSVQELDKIFQILNAKLKLIKEESLLGPQSNEDTVLELQVALIRRIVAVKLEEQAERKSASERKQKKDKILEILAAKQDEKLLNMTPEELTKILEDL